MRLKEGSWIEFKKKNRQLYKQLKSEGHVFIESRFNKCRKKTVKQLSFSQNVLMQLILNVNQAKIKAVMTMI